MDELSQFARLLGEDWAERIFSIWAADNKAFPAEWPGTTRQAIRLVLPYLDSSFDVGDWKVIVADVEQVARETWRALITTRARVA